MPEQEEVLIFFPFRARIAIYALAALLLFMPCCVSAPQGVDTIVLLPDASGHTGSIVVYSEGKEVRLSKEGEGVTVEKGSAPSEPFLLSSKEASLLTAYSLDMHPPQPKRYILYFEYDSDVLTKESAALSADMIKTIKDNPPTRINLAGHTDTVGNREYNFKLSLRRAKAVADLFTSQGIDSSIIDISYYGKEILLIETNDQVREPKNRRAEITIR